MLREVNMKDISDGRLYGSNDLVKADCGDCKGCHACCCGMGNSIVLDPLDVFRLRQGLNCRVEELLIDRIELNVVDGLILPNLKMDGEEEACHFLNEEGRCMIHAFRPGICRLFPLGRIYEEDGSFQYFLQTRECRHENRTKVKVKKWLDTPNLKENEEFIQAWHAYVKRAGQYTRTHPEEMKKVSMYVLQQFFFCEYDLSQDFYKQFKEKLSESAQF